MSRLENKTKKPKKPKWTWADYCFGFSALSWGVFFLWLFVAWFISGVFEHVDTDSMIIYIVGSFSFSLSLALMLAAFLAGVISIIMSIARKGKTSFLTIIAGFILIGFYLCLLIASIRK